MIDTNAVMMAMLAAEVEARRSETHPMHGVMPVVRMVAENRVMRAMTPAMIDGAS